MDELHRRDIVRGRQEIVGERDGAQLALRVVGEPLEQRAAEPLQRTPTASRHTQEPRPAQSRADWQGPA